MILPFVLLYKIWAIIQIGPVRTTPGKAVGYLFIPYFNLYWIFRVFLGWSRDYNRVLSEYGLEEHRTSEVLGGAASLVHFVWLASLFVRMSIDLGIERGIERDILISRGVFLLVLSMYAAVVSILFFWTAFEHANFLANKFNSGDISASKNCRLEVACPECGRGLKGATAQMIGETGICPKCGTEFEIRQGKTSGMAIASLVLSFYPLANIIGWILGSIALRRIKQSEGVLCGRRLALAGQTISVIHTGLLVFMFTLFVLTKIYGP